MLAQAFWAQFLLGATGGKAPCRLVVVHSGTIKREHDYMSIVLHGHPHIYPLELE